MWPWATWVLLMGFHLKPARGPAGWVLLGRKDVRGLLFGLGSLYADLKERRLNVVYGLCYRS